MITDRKAKNLMRKLIMLRAKRNESQGGELQYRKHEEFCVQQFRYVIDMHADRYRQFCNYEDLVQEGYIALLSAMKSYDPTKGSFFWWLHMYLKTRIKRAANTHTAIRFPLWFANQHQPRKENELPLIVDGRSQPDKLLEEVEIAKIIADASDKLDEFHRSVVSLYFGMGDVGDGAVKQVCRKLKISEEQCVQALNDAMSVLKDNIEI